MDVNGALFARHRSCGYVLKPQYQLPPFAPAAPTCAVRVTVVGVVAAAGATPKPPVRKLFFVRARVLSAHAHAFEADSPAFRLGNAPFVDAVLPAAAGVTPMLSFVRFELRQDTLAGSTLVGSCTHWLPGIKQGVRRFAFVDKSAANIDAAEYVLLASVALDVVKA